MEQRLRKVFAILAIIVGIFILGNSVISIFRIGLENMTIVKIISIFAGTILIIAGIIATIISNKSNSEQIRGKRHFNYILIIIITSVVIASLFTIGIIGYIVMNWTEKDKTTDITQYEQYLGENGSHSGINLIESDIFPNSIPKTAKVEKFLYEYYNPWDPCFCVFLEYTCNDEEYVQEIKRLQNIDSSPNYNVYGLTEFPYTLCAVNADSYNGIIYAMTEEDENKIIYIEVTSCNYFNDIDYEELIDKKYLPNGFDMTYNNPTQRKEK